MMQVRFADQQDRIRWDEYVLSHESSGPFQVFAWQYAVENGYGHRSCYLLAEDDKKEIQGVLPLVSVKIPFVKEILISQPFCDYGGVLANDEAVFKALLGRAMDLAEDRGAELEIRFKELTPVPTLDAPLEARTNKSRMLLYLPESSELLWDCFKSKLRSQIRKSQKEGLVFILGNREMLDEFYRIFCENMRVLGSPVHSKKWFEAVYDAYQDSAHTGVVMLNKKPVAAGIILCHKETVTIPWASTLREYNAMSPNMLLYWGFLQYASDHRFTCFDFGRSTPGEGTYRFKEQWGARPFPLYWYGRSKGKGSHVDFTAGKLREHITRVWAGIPLPVVNALGPLLRKYITL